MANHSTSKPSDALPLDAERKCWYCHHTFIAPGCGCSCHVLVGPVASPALPETVVAVLRACDRQDSEGFDEGHSDQRIDAAVRAWRAAGRPGLK